jgi:hypothetical protein
MERGAEIWPMDAAWDAAVEVCAVGYGVAVDVIRAESRGRGPRPPRDTWQAKKMAVHLTVSLTNCDYAALGRAVGLHKDTIASHCAGIREAMAEDEAVERHSDVFAGAAVTRMQLRGVAPVRRERAPEVIDHKTPGGRLRALEIYVLGLLQTARAALSDEREMSSDALAISSDTSRIRDQKPRNAA